MHKGAIVSKSWLCTSASQARYLGGKVRIYVSLHVQSVLQTLACTVRTSVKLSDMALSPICILGFAACIKWFLST